MKFSQQMQREHAFVGVRPEEENMKKKMIDEKIKIETKLADNVFPVPGAAYVLDSEMHLVVVGVTLACECRLRHGDHMQ